MTPKPQSKCANFIFHAYKKSFPIYSILFLLVYQKKVQKINVKAIKMRHKKSISLSKKMSSQSEEREQTFFSFIVNSFIRATKGDERKEGKKKLNNERKEEKEGKKLSFTQNF